MWFLEYLMRVILSTFRWRQRWFLPPHHSYESSAGNSVKIESNEATKYKLRRLTKQLFRSLAEDPSIH